MARNFSSSFIVFEVISVVVEGIRCNSKSSVVMASISTLYHLLYESTDTSAEHLARHISALLGSLASLANDRQSQCLDVRKQAALCLELLSHMPSPIILHCKEEVRLYFSRLQICYIKQLK